MTLEGITRVTTANSVTLETLFTEARTQNGFLPEPVSEEQIKQLYDLFKWGPTSANMCPARVVFLTSTEAKERLIPLLSANNQEHACRKLFLRFFRCHPIVLLLQTKVLSP